MPVRLFESALLERFTTASPRVVAAVWGTAVLLAVVLGVARGTSGVTSVAAFGAGVIAWSPFEYAVHRWLFHFNARSRWSRRVVFVLHGCHHADPGDARRDMMPLVCTIPVGLVLLGVAVSVIGTGPGLLAFGGFVGGYLAYDLTHFALHQADCRRRVLRRLQQHHLEHHSRAPSANFGVSSPCLDVLMRTKAVARERW